MMCVFAFHVFGCSSVYLTGEEERKVTDILSESYKNENWQTRKEVITNICPYKSPKAENLLITALSDIHPAVRIEALNCLQTKKSSKAKKTIREIAESDSDYNVRMSAILSLSKYRDPATAPVFVRGLRSDDWLIREESIKGLLMIDDMLIKQISVPYIIQALNDSRINVRLATLENVKIKDKRIYSEISAIINNEENYYKVNLLNASLKAINGYLLDKTIREKLIGFLTHPYMEIRISALGVLKKDKELQEAD
ncbi:MAG: HEAT repeat domain-containing protein [Spirochaetota bacterium]